MFYKLMCILAFTLAVVGVVPALASDTAETVSGIVQEVDSDNERLIVLTERDETVELTVPRTLLKGVKPGNYVTIEMTNGKVTALQNDGSA